MVISKTVKLCAFIMFSSIIYVHFCLLNKHTRIISSVSDRSFPLIPTVVVMCINGVKGVDTQTRVYL